MNHEFITLATAPIEDLTQRIAALVYRRLGSHLHEFHVCELAQGLALQGRVTSFYGKQLAQIAATELSGRSIFANDLEVCSGEPPMLNTPAVLVFKPLDGPAIDPIIPL